LDERRRRKQRKAIDRKAEEALKRQAQQVSLEVDQAWPTEQVNGKVIYGAAATETLWQKGQAVTREQVMEKRAERRINILRTGKMGDGQVV
jgi:hypothetical protein